MPWVVDGGCCGTSCPGTDDDVVAFVDWPHARLGAPSIELLTVLSTVPASGIDPEPILGRHAPNGLDTRAVDGVLAALAGFHLQNGLAGVPAALRPIATAKIALGRSALHWLAQRNT